jgi:LmbE family N-acetylglucosaminyl deacetylase
MRILCLHAHPDDAEIFAGGTLALLAERGNQVVIATMTAGDCGTTEHSVEEISDIRRSESARSAQLIGAEYHCLGFHDLAIFNDDASRRKVTNAIRRFRAQLVITASPVDYHCDHEATSTLVRDACFGASAPNYRTHALSTEPPRVLAAIPHLYFVDPAEGMDRDGRVQAPGFVVDVASTFAKKREMLACHESQRAWLHRQHGMDDYLATMEVWCRARGALAAAPYGEGFRQYTGHPYPTAPLLQTLLGDGLVRELR